jgi:hypothetical protein
VANYYELWSKRVSERRGEIDATVGRIHKGIEAVIGNAGLEDMLYQVEAKPNDASIGAVDGGEGLLELSGVAAYLIRASGLVKREKSEFIRDLDLGVLPINRQTKARVQFMRAAMEYDIARRLADGFKPDYLLIDGSLLVGVEIDPIKIDEYKAYIESLRSLIAAAYKNNVKLVGVSEDSTSRGLIGYLSEKGLGREAARTLDSLTDASLLQLYIQRRYGCDFSPVATKPFIPVSNKGRDWIIKNTGIDKSFPTFYLQATRMGRPLRVDFPSDGKGIGERAREIASLLAYLSQVPKRYGYPLPLYLAHSDAELPKALMERTAMLIQKQIFKSWSGEYLAMYGKKRRDSRPVDYE